MVQRLCRTPLVERRAGEVPAVPVQRHHHRRGGDPAARLQHLQGVSRTGVAAGHHGGGAVGGLRRQHHHDHRQAQRGADVHLPLVHARHPGRRGGALPGQRRRGAGVAVQVVLGLRRHQRRQRAVVVRPQRRGHGADHAAAGHVLLFPAEIDRGADLQPPALDHRLLVADLHVPVDRRPSPAVDPGSRLGADPGHGLLADADRPQLGLGLQRLPLHERPVAPDARELPGQVPDPGDHLLRPADAAGTVAGGAHLLGLHPLHRVGAGTRAHGHHGLGVDGAVRRHLLPDATPLRTASCTVSRWPTCTSGWC